MKSNRLTATLVLLLGFLGTLSTAPAYGANRDIIELQTEITQLQQQMTQMKQSFDERMGVMKNLLEQNTDVINKATAAVGALQSSIDKQQQDRAGQGDQLSGQIQSLNDTMDELKVRLTKLSKQLEDLQTAQQSMAAQQTQAQQQAKEVAQAPAPDVLYNNALRDYNGGKNDLAVQEFTDYVKFYPDTDLAGNSYFYVAEIQYKAGDFKKAIASYDLVLQNFPSGNKAAAAELKKGFALLELGREEEGTQELKRVIQRYPRTNEATQAKERLRKAGVTTRNPKPQ
jgi:tol-pal system protein YbgF